MYKPIDRCTVQVDDNRYRIYPKEGPLFCKDENYRENDREENK